MVCSVVGKHVQPFKQTSCRDVGMVKQLSCQTEPVQYMGLLVPESQRGKLMSTLWQQQQEDKQTHLQAVQCT